MSSTPPRQGADNERAVTVTLTGRAARWLQLLQEFGHIDADSTDRLLIFISDLATRERRGENPLWVDLPEVRRATALLLVRDLEDGGPFDLLEEDWPLFFS